MAFDKEHIYELLDRVKDPEIPVLSLVDLGVITAVEVKSDQAVRVELTPTFVGCPALEFMKNEITEVLRKENIKEVEVVVSFKKPWSSDLISEKGKQALKKFGLAPPGPSQLFTDLDVLERAQCPRCDGNNTELRNTFGPTLCRSIHYCNTCHEAFEQFKAL